MFRSCLRPSEKAPPTLEPVGLPTNKADGKVLLEIVGAMGLSMIKDCANSFCTVGVSQNTKHTTSIIYNDTSPIWTVETKSLCLLELKEKDEVAIDLRNSNRIGFSQTICGVTLDFASLAKGSGDRIEYELFSEENASQGHRERPFLFF
jgi:Ca2+-dependent lipid-binding protein